jgi:hypothetical protein
MAFDVRPCRDLGEFGRAIFPIDQYLGSGLTDERIERFSHLLEIERMHAAFDGDEIVGGAGGRGSSRRRRRPSCSRRCTRP